MKNICCLYLLFCLTAFPLLSQAKNGKKIFSLKQEIESLNRADLLPEYRTKCYVEQFSSYDPNWKNDDGFEGTHSYICKEAEDRLVLAEMDGPGVINRIWTPTPTNDTLSFYFDGKKEPGLVIRFSDLFSGKVYPFINPICGNEIGGYYCYMPIPYKKSCKIVFHGKKIRFHQIQYRNLPGYKVETYNKELAEGAKSELKHVATIWNKRKTSINDFAMGKSSNYKMLQKTFLLKPGEEQVFFTLNHSGRIVGFEIDAADNFEGLNRDVMLCAHWDGELIAAINAPAADFFGYAYGKAAMRSMLIGKNEHSNYCYIPFPFDRKAVMKLVYKERKGYVQNPIQVTTRVYYNSEIRNKEKEGKFYSMWRREIYPKDGEYYSFANIKGKGHYIGTVHLAQGMKPGMTSFFEGDDSTYVDGKMRLHGTGSEDYYNGGWYAIPDCWDAGISLPLHGCLDYTLALSRTGGYRFYMSDKLPYEKEFYMGIEHGWENNDYPVDYTSVAYYYSGTPLSQGSMEATQKLRTTYMPDEHTYFPELVDVIVDGRVRVERQRGLGLIAAPGGKVRFKLDALPEGEYELYLNYYKKPKGANFMIWQRQKKITEWQSSYSDRDELQENVFMGKIYITRHTNTITFHVSKHGEEGTELELKLIHLKKIY